MPRGANPKKIRSLHKTSRRRSPFPRASSTSSGAIVVGSFLLTLFVRNPYTQAVHEGGSFYENSMDNSLMLWVAIFIGIPASFWAYKRWILPLFDRK